MISARAQGILFELIYQGRSLSSEYLSQHFKEGRDAIRTALSELCEAAYITRTRENINGKIMSITRVTAAGYQHLLGPDYQAIVEILRRRISRQQIQPSEQLAYTLYNLNLVNQTSGDPTKETEVPYEFFERTSSDDELINAKIKKEAARKEARQQAKQDKRTSPKTIRRHQVPKENWSSVDTGFEFAYRLEKHWNIDPFTLRTSILVPAIAKMRARLDTDGEIECKMMDYFFSKLEMEKFKDGEMLARMFIKQADELYENATASLAVVSEEEKVLTDKSWDWMK